MKIPGTLRWHQREMLKAVDTPEVAANSDVNGKEDKKESCSLLVIELKILEQNWRQNRVEIRKITSLPG